MKKILVTGGNGFVGRALVKALLHRGYEVVATARNSFDHSQQSENLSWVTTGQIDGETDWSKALSNVDVVIHTAGRAHVLNEKNIDPLGEFRKINVDGTIRLASQAAMLGIKKFIFISSISVYADGSCHDLTEHSLTAPSGAYGISKLEAEEALRLLITEDFQITIIRPPLLYGADCKGNFQRLVKLVNSGLPLPFKSVNNKRSLMGVDNLVDFLVVCVEKDEANNLTFLVADDEILSLPDLVRMIANAMGRNAILLPVPLGLMRVLLRMIGKDALLEKMCGDLVLNTSFARTRLSWRPSKSAADGIREMAAGYRRGK